MITINLKPGLKRAKAGSSFLGGLGALKELPGKVKDPWPMAAVGAVVVTLGFLGFTGVSTATNIGRLEPKLESVKAENRRFRAFLQEKRRAELARDSVLQQIATIQVVDGDRYVWPHILDEITRALPPYTWLVDVSATAQAAPADSSGLSAPPVGVQLIGRTMDIQGFTRFMRQLEDSRWLRNVTVLSTETVIDHGRAVTAFTLKADYERKPAAAPAAAAEAPPAGGR
jgi:Tfp pilus assembly protein PilN